jgi:hypothetical protein
MPVRFSTPFKNLGSADLKRESRVRFDKVVPPPGKPLPTSCPDLQTVFCLADNWNRPNNVFLGANWNPYHGLIDFPIPGAQNYWVWSINGGLLRTVRTGGINGPCLPPPSNQAYPLLASYKPFAASTVDQSSRLIYAGSAVLPDNTLAGNPNNIATGGPTVRMQQVGAGDEYPANVVAYLFEYREKRGFVFPFPIVSAEVRLRQIGAIVANFNTLVIPPLTIGDELKITAANFVVGVPPFDQLQVCIKGYVNDVLKLQKTVAGPNALFAGRPGFSTHDFLSVCGYALDFDDWQGCEMEPV